jgi:hypothetical protein
MRGTFMAAAALVAAALAGCIGAGDDEDLATQALARGDAVVSVASAVTAGSEVASWQGRELDARREPLEEILFLPSRECGDQNCERVPFQLAFPEGFWDTHDGAVEVSLLYDNPEGDLALALTVHDAGGAVVGEGRRANYATTLLMDEPASGDYEAEVVALDGAGPYTGIVQVEARPVEPGPARELLPDLVVLPPLDVGIPGTFTNVLGFGPPANPVTDAAGLRGCDAWENAEQRARKCLRLTNSLGNLGEGFLEVHLTFQEGVKALAGQGQFVQRIHSTDGSFEDAPVAGAAFHPTHAHFHYQDLAVFTLYSYDLATHARGEEVAQTGKSGFCFYDMGLVLPDHVGTTPPLMADEANCFLDPEEDWVTGVSPGWFDRYWTTLSDQYVEVTGLPDGIYELVSTANGAETLIEANYDNNSSGAILEISGNDVTVIETWADYLGGPPFS